MAERSLTSGAEIVTALMSACCGKFAVFAEIFGGLKYCAFVRHLPGSLLSAEERTSLVIGQLMEGDL